MKTIAVFRKYPEGEVIALFPFLNEESGDANRGMCMSYMHVGQHGETDYDGVIRCTKPAADWEVEDLAGELAGIGYELDIRARKPLQQ